MKVGFYLIVNSNGTVRTTKSKVGLNWNEISIHCNLELPNALFQKPHLEANIVIPNEAAMPQQLEADTIANVKEAIEQASGLEVKLSLIKPEE